MPPNSPSTWQTNKLLRPPGTDVATAHDEADNKPSEVRRSGYLGLFPNEFSLDLPNREIREEIGVLARAASEAFANACKSTDSVGAENSFAGVSARIKELWHYRTVRDLPFRDLLAAVDAAIRHRLLSEFDKRQRDAIGLAFRLLCHWHIGPDEVDETIKRFVDLKIDILGPVTSGKRKLKITVTEIADNDNAREF